MNSKTLLFAALAIAPAVLVTTKSAFAQRQALQKDPVIACNKSGMTRTERKRQDALASRLINAAHAVHELSDGYEMIYKDGARFFVIVAEWAALETRCCPFFEIGLTLGANNGPLTVRLCGGKGVKEFMKDAKLVKAKRCGCGE
jgi:hypothetical protein